MKIFCNCNNCGYKIHLASPAISRNQLANSWGASFFINCPSCQLQNQIHVNQVWAEVSHVKTLCATTVGGGAFGIIAGPLGILIGLAVGGVTGSVALSRDNEDVKYFNNNYL